MSEIQWIKISVGLFDDAKIKIIEGMPEHDTILVIWLKLLIWAGQDNDRGNLRLSGVAMTDEHLAAVLGRNINTVRIAIQTLLSLKMIELQPDNTLTIRNWEKWQNIEGMERVRLQTKARTEKYRLLLEEGHSESSDVTIDATVTSQNVTDTLRDGTDKIRIDKNRIEEDNTTTSNQNVFILPSWINTDTWNDYVEMRKKIRKPPTERAKILAIRYLTSMRELGHDPNAILEQSIMNSWQGLFELKQGGTHGTVQGRPGKGNRELPTEYISPEEARRRRAAARQVGS